LAAERRWELIGIADNALERIDDADGPEDVFGEAMVELGRICASLPQGDPCAIASCVLTICERSGFGVSGALIQRLGGSARAGRSR
jgi:hypothetical protein